MQIKGHIDDDGSVINIKKHMGEEIFWMINNDVLEYLQFNKTVTKKSRFSIISIFWPMTNTSEGISSCLLWSDRGQSCSGADAGPTQATQNSLLRCDTSESVLFILLAQAQ